MMQQQLKLTIMIKRAVLAMTEGQFDADNKYTQAYENAYSDYNKARTVIGSKEVDEDDIMGQLENTTLSDKVANQKGYYYKSSHAAENTFSEIETPTMVLHLDKTDTHRTGIATLTIKIK